MDASHPEGVTVGPTGGLTPFDLATAYGYDPLTNAQSQTVAIVDAYDDPTIESDLQKFDAYYGLLSCTTANGCFGKVNQEGAASPLPRPSLAWSGEIALDVEVVHAVCESCHILLVEADDSSDANLEAAVDEAAQMGATEISNSYGGAIVPTAADLAAYDHPGIVITAGAGDDGYDSYDLWPLHANAAVPYFPAAAATVVAVGGTTLRLTAVGTRARETVWNDNGADDLWQRLLLGFPFNATGGGCSTTIPAPAWQSELASWPDTGCGPYRLSADIASDADYLTGFDVYDTTGWFGWSTVGGTSLSTPTIAAMFALAGGAHGVAYPASTLYAHLSGADALYDVTAGGNGYCGGLAAQLCGDVNGPQLGQRDCDFNTAGTSPAPGELACDAAPGYDGPTGVGTPDGLAAFSPPVGLAPSVIALRRR
jgi:subtilase family serine protease